MNNQLRAREQAVNWHISSELAQDKQLRVHEQAGEPAQAP